MPRTGSLLLSALLAAMLVPGLAVPASTSKCTARKLGAAARYFDGVAKCEARAVAKRRSLDVLCVARAQTKYFSRQEKAEGVDDCLTLGDALPLQDVLDDAIPDVLDILETPPAASCCQTNANVCLWLSSATCMTIGGTPGAAGTVCSAGGACVAPPAVAGSCCEGLDESFLMNQCASGLVLTASCAADGGVLVDGGACDPSGYCLASGERPPSKCTSRKLKAAGKYFRGISRCEAKGVAKGVPPDLLCEAKARSKLLRAFGRAENKGDCIVDGEHAAAENELDGALKIVFKVLEPPPSVCCQGTAVCSWTADEASCMLANGTVGAPGTVCNATNGECAAPPSGEGPCCQDFIPAGLTETTCVASPSVNLGNCGSGGGTFVDDAVCLPSRLCID